LDLTKRSDFSLPECGSSAAILQILTESTLESLWCSWSHGLSGQLYSITSDLGDLPIIVSYPFTSLMLFVLLRSYIQSLV
jgi:hypothetical protein